MAAAYVAETLMPLILELEKAYNDAKADPKFQKEMDGHLATYVGRPSPLYFAERLTQHCGGAKIYFKREELNHTGAHKVNNVLGQIMLARRMGKTRIIAETGAGMHGVATATLCAKFGLPCIVYMGSVDVERQQPNVLRMKILGAEVRAVESGSKTLKDAMNEALRDWVANVHDTFYCIGTVAGPHPYPTMVRDFQSIIGRETREQMQAAEGRLPNSLIACIGGGSNAMGLFHPFLDDRSIEIYGVEAAGLGLKSGKHAASIAGGRPGVLHGNRTYLLMDGRRTDRGGAFDFRRPRLSRHRSRACLAQRYGPGDIPLGDRQRGGGGVPALQQARRHHPGAGAGARARSRARPRTEEVEGSSDGGQRVRPRRQGPCIGRAISRRKVAHMTRIDRRFAALKEEGRAGLVTFITAGDPDYDTSLALLKALPAAGADIIELGMPFSDPMADGPAIQASSQRALKAGQTMKKTLAMVKAFREQDKTTPIVLMGYYNPIYVYPAASFLKDAATAGVDGLIVVDMPPEEDEELRPAASEAGLNFIRLATPTTDAKRLPAVLANSSGFVYYVSIAGITGTAAPDAAKVGAHVARIKAQTDLPIAVGFGVRTKEQVKSLARTADAVVVGSALVSAVAQSLDQAGKATKATASSVLSLVEQLASGLRETADANA